jgi:apolipoprotein N-acyltransferase
MNGLRQRCQRWLTHWSTTWILLPMTFAVLHDLAYAPFQFAPAGLLCFTPLFLLPETTALRRFLHGWTAGLAMQALGYYWIFYTIGDFGGLSDGLALLGSLLFFLYQGLDLAIWLLFLPFLARRGTARIWLGAAFWLVISRYFPAIFPWQLGASQVGFLGLKAQAAWLGSYGLGFFAVAFSGVVAQLLVQGYSSKAGLMALLSLLLLGLLPLPRELGPVLRVGMVQPNFIPLAKKKQPDGLEFYNRHMDATRELVHHRLDLVLWPETALPFPLEGNPAYFMNLQQEAQNLGCTLILGCIGHGANSFTNDIRLFPADGSTVQRYQKQRLVLFSEHLPWILRWALRFVPGLGSFESGPFRDNLNFRGLEIVPLVCYEAILPDYVLEKQGWLMVNLTNDAWFGRGKGSACHLQHLVLRCLETGMPLLRATNSGISCLVTAEGEVLGATEVYSQASPTFQFQASQLAWRPALWAYRLLHYGSLLALALAWFRQWRNRSAPGPG